MGSAVRMGRRNLFAGRRNGSRAAQILPESPGRQCPTTETDAAGEEVIETPGASAKPGLSTAAHADGRPPSGPSAETKIKIAQLRFYLKTYFFPASAPLPLADQGRTQGAGRRDRAAYRTVCEQVEAADNVACDRQMHF